MNRADKARAIVMFEELVTALRAELHAEAADEHAQGSTPSWRMGDVTVAASLSNPTVVVDDADAFRAYVEATAPSEVETVVTTVTQVRPAYAKSVLARLAKTGEPMCDAEGTIIPGLRFMPGGALRSVSVRPSAEFKDQAALFAAEVASGQRLLALPSIVDGEPVTIDAPEPAAPVVEATATEWAATEWAQWPAPDAGASFGSPLDDIWATFGSEAAK